MTAKEKVLKIEPEALCWHYRYETGKTKCWIAVGGDSSKVLSRSQPREKWAWAEAYRNLTTKLIIKEK